MRIVKPASKLQSIQLLKEYFNISHRRQSLYENISEFINKKDQMEKVVIDMAVKEFGFDFSLVFYDVTTLYFEAFTSDKLRKTGFSKDNKPNQPQIVIGLVVNNIGFPIAYEIFEGNKFEGHTILPVITSFTKKHHIKVLTVVADAAMISHENIEQLKEDNLNYIVGARMGNLPRNLIQNIHNDLGQKDGTSLRISTKLGNLVCDFSQKRYKKDKQELEKQITKAEAILKHGSELKKSRFVISTKKTHFTLNTDLIEKHKLLLGIKGYYTNLGTKYSNDLIIQRYHDLWHVEHAFRISKNDLEMRPIYHFKDQSIRIHILICFIALAISQYIEIKTSKSIHSVIHSLLRITDAHLVNNITKEKIVKRTKISEETKKILAKLSLSY